jgi:hypothetical protein
MKASIFAAMISTRSGIGTDTPVDFRWGGILVAGFRSSVLYHSALKRVPLLNAVTGLDHIDKRM